MDEIPSSFSDGTVNVEVEVFKDEEEEEQVLAVLNALMSPKQTKSTLDPSSAAAAAASYSRPESACFQRLETVSEAESDSPRSETAPNGVHSSSLSRPRTNSTLSTRYPRLLETVHEAVTTLAEADEDDERNSSNGQKKTGFKQLQLLLQKQSSSPNLLQVCCKMLLSFAFFYYFTFNYFLHLLFPLSCHLQHKKLHNNLHHHLFFFVVVS
jgi:hypothetical protein